MNHFSCVITNIQHIVKLEFSIDLSENQLMCIVGKNGVGKTTLIRAIKNIKVTDTFTRTASPYIFNSESEILYTIDGVSYNFKYNSQLDVVDTKQIIEGEIKKSIHVELPIPHGERFYHFQRLSDIDEELRKNISLKEYRKPNELISFLSNVYSSSRFDDLKEVSIKDTKYYFILKEENFYIREDYLSSGEYFVINLYKSIQRKCKLIVIDEIDISLDASAQVNLVNELRKFCNTYQVNIIFTTHSLAIMKKLNDSELHYMVMNESTISICNESYNFVKSILFGFKGWDKYILTEDKMLQKYLNFLIEDIPSVFYRYIIIYIGGGGNVIDLMDRNNEENFFSSRKNIITILDGDQRGISNEINNVYFIPFESVEKELFRHYESGELVLDFDVTFTSEKKRGKELYHCIKGKRIMTDRDIFSFINARESTAVKELKDTLADFLVG